jgi:IS5 family transposase
MAKTGSVLLAIDKRLADAKTKSQICEKGSRNKPLTEEQKQSNRDKSKVRARVEHVFGAQAAMGGHLVRTIGLLRAKVKIGLMNLVYNMVRLMQLIKLNSKSAGPGGIDNHGEGAPIAV